MGTFRLTELTTTTLSIEKNKTLSIVISEAVIVLSIADAKCHNIAYYAECRGISQTLYLNHFSLYYEVV